MDQERRYYTGLDGLRGLAAVVVVFHHAFFTYKPQIFSRGSLAVDFFFMLSGFVIEEAYGKNTSIYTFLIQRFVRLYPALLLAAVVSLLCSCDKSDTTIFAIKQAFLIPSFFVDEIYPLNPAIWSMFSEILINIFFIIVIKNIKNYLIVFISMISVFILIIYGSKYHTLSVGPHPGDFFGGPLRVCFAFPIGILISRIALPSKMPIVNIRSLAVMFLAIFSIPHVLHGDYIVEIVLVVLVLPCLFVIATNASVDAPSAVVCRLLGMLSYPLYVIHMPILHFFSQMWPAQDGMERLAASILSIMVGCAATLFFDKPVRRWLASEINKRVSAPIHAR